MPSEKKKREIHSGAVFKLFWKHTRPYPWFFAISIFGIFLNEGANIIAPLFMRDIINLLSTSAPSPQIFSAALLILSVYTVIGLVGWFGGRIEMWFGYQLIAKVTANLTKEAFAVLMRHSHQYFASSFSGALTRRVARFSGAYENLYFSIVTVLFESSVYIIGVSVVLLLNNVILGIIVSGWVVFFIVLQWYLNQLQRSYRIARSSADTDLTASLADSIANQNTVALFAAGSYEEAVVGKAADNLRDKQIKAWNFNNVIYGSQGLLAIALNVGMLAVGTYLWSRGVISLGDVVLIQAYVFGIFNNVWNLGRQFNMIYNGLADATEMIDVIKMPIEVADTRDAKPLSIEKGILEFRKVSFAFGEKRQVLNDFNLTIAAGEKVALVGPSGAGKSTITKLLLRLYDPTRGSVLIDKQDLKDVTQDSVRASIGFVPQEPVLFHRSLMENIRYGRRNATDEEVIAAAKDAHCHEFIKELSDGYHTLVGERGIKLSGGERQRVAIARAILKNAPILVLDEATSSLDSESEALIQDALSKLMENKTVLVIAHRLSTIMRMDRIVVIEKGKLIAEGTHDELVQDEGLYRKLWSIQAGGFIVDEAELAETPKNE